ncbi:hypothetical protein LOTGIDRAFT_118213 [Lottia gigantea]|uniref:Sulfotransferase domain-containing protein n=1 Tax=Lottia gigantea TaxID=225164 RepID=V4BZM8_LOTGI|nr:hypothetical protein LOTGIDRAFT_118213 [Lottia gigantea]ESO94604.1 hypothetical protein LOTGIDRAFT_118213 [Lottia gigantea]
MTSGRSSIKYHIIQQGERLDETRKKILCPKLTRYKLLAIVFILVVTVFCIVISNSQLHFLRGNSVCLSGNSSNHKERLEHLPHTKRRLPQCIIIGARKAGTRALLSFLNIHPDIQAVGRELHFFDFDENYELGYDWYRKKMPYTYKTQLTIEKTPSYLVESVVPERVYAMNSSIKLILIVKDPVERTISDYAQFRENKIIRHKPVIPFENLVIDADTGDINRSYNAVRRSIYCRHLQKWLKYFSFDQIKIVDGDNLTRAPWKEIRKVESFLGISHEITKSDFVFNVSRGFYCIKNDDASEKCLSRSKGRKHPSIQPWIKNKLRAFFHQFNLKFYRLTGRDFGWDDSYYEDEEEEEKGQE